MSRTKIIPILFFTLVFLLAVSYFNPYLSMRRFILFDNPIAAFSAKINSHYNKDPQYGHCYHIKGWKDPLTKSYMEGICLKRKFIIYYVTAHGGG